jgi:hypothetical protein
MLVFWLDVVGALLTASVLVDLVVLVLVDEATDYRDDGEKDGEPDE